MAPGRCDIRLTRYYRAAPHEVWAALTEPASLARWLGLVHEVELISGGAFALELGGVRAKVRAAEAERLLELDWSDSGTDSVVRFELAQDGKGTVLTVDHVRIDAVVGMRAMARWETHLRRLDAVVQGLGPQGAVPAGTRSAGSQGLYPKGAVPADSRSVGPQGQPLADARDNPGPVRG